MLRRDAMPPLYHPPRTAAGKWWLPYAEGKCNPSPVGRRGQIVPSPAERPEQEGDLWRIWWRIWLRPILGHLLTGRIGEIPEEVGIRSQHEPQIGRASCRERE